MAPPSGNDPEPLAFQASAQTFYATTARAGAAGGDRTRLFRFTKAARKPLRYSGKELVADIRFELMSPVYETGEAPLL